MPRHVRRQPREIVEEWPAIPRGHARHEVELNVTGGIDDDDFVVPARVARQLVVNLLEAIGDKPLSGIAQQCNVEYSSLVRIAKGETWPDLVTIVRLEDGLDVNLWPGRLNPDSNDN